MQINRSRFLFKISMSQKLIYYFLSLSFLTFNLTAQTPTMGLIQNTTGSFNGYTLFSPNAYEKTFLIDNCGIPVKSWQSSYSPGLSAYLLESGKLLRTARINNQVFSGLGGSGGRLELFDWSGNISWSFNYSDSMHYQHHDIEVLPNGNILLIAWEFKTSSEAIAQGRNPALTGPALFPEHIIELEPTGTNTANIIWEWHVWDHLIQDFDSLKPNYGVVEDHPELINLNFSANSNQDWLHINSIDYNPLTDEILLSVHNFSEIWIIDHSTTTLEAAGHSGGNSGKGGDLLFRWGNPRAYQRGNAPDQIFWAQHDAHWIEQGLKDEGKIMIFNNGLNRPGSDYSSVDIIEPIKDSLGQYLFNSNLTFAPDTVFWRFTSSPPTDFYSSNISGAQRLGNGNTLICEGSSGNFFEVDSSGSTVWNYINPVNQNGPMIQGNNPSGNAVFRCTRFAPDYPGLTGQVLTGSVPIELMPYTSTCSLFTGLEDQNLSDNSNISIYPNPASQQINIENFSGEEFIIKITDMSGKIRIMLTGKNMINIPLSDFCEGVYIISLETSGSVTKKLFLKI